MPTILLVYCFIKKKDLLRKIARKYINFLSYNSKDGGGFTKPPP